MGATSLVVGAGSRGSERMVALSEAVATAGGGVGLAVGALWVLLAATGAGVGVAMAATGAGGLVPFFAGEGADAAAMGGLAADFLGDLPARVRSAASAGGRGCGMVRRR